MSPIRDQLRTCLIVSTAFLATLQVSGTSAEDADAARWGPLRLLEGSWRGEVLGPLGQGTGVRRYEFLFDGRYLVTRHSSVRVPQPQSPQGDHHRELTVYSYDRERETLVLREFNVEGYVLQYDCDVDARRIVCTSTSIESGAGMRARMTLEIEDRYHFEESFELAAPGDELMHYLTVHWTRAPDLGD